MSRPRVLIVDDEAPMRSFLVRNLEARGYEPSTAANGYQALAQLQDRQFELVVLDVMMPAMDGIELCQRLRERSTVPILVVTALGEEKDRVRALDAGADDCLTKPFGVDELVARVKAVLRRASWAADQQPARLLSYRGLCVDVDGLTATLDGEPLDLTRTELRLLTTLLAHAGKLMPHAVLLREVWGPEYGEEAEYLRVYVGRLRRKLGDDSGDPTYIFTEHGLGYRLGG